MRYFITEHFKRQLKLILKKHHLSLDDLIKDLERFDERQAVSLGAGAYKIRLRLRDLPKGKSSSFRLIVLYVKQEELIAPLTIYARTGSTGRIGAQIKWPSGEGVTRLSAKQLRAGSSPA